MSHYEDPKQREYTENFKPLPSKLIVSSYEERVKAIHKLCIILDYELSKVNTELEHINQILDQIKTISGVDYYEKL